MVVIILLAAPISDRCILHMMCMLWKGRVLPVSVESMCLMCSCCAGEDDGVPLQTGEPSSSASADTSLLTGSASYMFFDADEAANQKQQKKKGKGKKE